MAVTRIIVDGRMTIRVDDEDIPETRQEHVIIKLTKRIRRLNTRISQISAQRQEMIGERDALVVEKDAAEALLAEFQAL